jgi:hypothetical protein
VRDLSRSTTKYDEGSAPRLPERWRDERSENLCSVHDSDSIAGVITHRTRGTQHLHSGRHLAATIALLAGLTLAGVKPARAEGPPERTGSIILGAGIGPAFSLSGGSAGFGLLFDGSYAFADHLYGVFQPSFVFGGGTLVLLPVGVQYDIPIPSVPGLYLYPRGSLGVALGGGSAAFMLMFEGGVKYNIQDKFYVGFEPFSLPIFIGSGGTVAGYRLNFLAGIYL